MNLDRRNLDGCLLELLVTVLDVDDPLAAHGIARRIVATVPGFAGVPALLRGQINAAVADAPVTVTAAACH
jgi:hypothetical protein